MTAKILEFCQKEIADLLAKGIIRKSKSPWSCAAFYVRKIAEIERGVPRLVINYKCNALAFFFFFFHILSLS
jgi:hypothetical protein